MKTFLSTNSVRLLVALPLFFIVHGYVGFYPLIPVEDAFNLYLIYLGIGLILSTIARLLMRNWSQSLSFSFLLLAVEFFFGAFHDSIRNIFPHLFIHKYSVLLPILLGLVILAWKKIRDDRWLGPRSQRYLLITLLLLTGIDLLLLTFQPAHKQPVDAALTFDQPTSLTSDSLPDIHLIIADEYPGQIALTQTLNHSNDSFLYALHTRGFYTADSASSNYNFTEFSTASLFHLDYLRPIYGRQASLNHLSYCFDVLKSSPWLNQLQSIGYQFTNHSIFDFNDHPSPVKPTWLPARTKAITEQTLTSRLIRDLGFHFFTDIPGMASWFELDELNRRNNSLLRSMTLDDLSRSFSKPNFTYTHLMLPHFPYYYEESGKLRPRSEWVRSDTAAFLSYLGYTNKQLLSLVDEIRARSKRPVAILLIGDHGLRTYPKPVAEKNHFLTLVAVLLPNRNYEKFYPSISHVNLLRTTANSLFGTKLPRLKDSTIFLRE